MGKHAEITNGHQVIVTRAERRKPLALLISLWLGTSGSGWAADIARCRLAITFLI
jgi:hypothetical protein